MERKVKTETDQEIYVCDWDDGGVWFKMGGRYASMHTTMTREQAKELIAGLQIALGCCPKCGGEEWTKQEERDGTQWADCPCGHSWTLE